MRTGSLFNKVNLNVMKIVRFFLCTAAVLLLATGQITILHAQNKDVIEEVNLFPDRFKSIQFYVVGAELSLPVASLGRSVPLELRFDDLEHGDSFSYSIMHCDRNWRLSDIPSNEYLEGWESERMREFSYSVGTRVSYTHNWLRLPNDDMSWLLSGNYALMIFDDDWSDEEPVIVRRFMVVDPKVEVFPSLTPALGTGKYNTAHELNVDIRIDEGVRIARPQQEISISVIQNNQWLKAKNNIFATVERRDRLSWNLPQQLQFMAGKDYRSLDLRSARAPMGRTKILERQKDEIVALIRPDEPRDQRTFIDNADLNGAFIILDEDVQFDPYQIEDYTQTADNIDILRLHTQTEYIKVLFTLLQRDKMTDHNVYVTGSWCDWELREDNKMVWEPDYSAYMITDLVKQGFYDYEYVTLPKSTDVNYEVDVEGDRFETENLYSIFVYYREYGGRYDELIGVHQFLSNR